MQPLPPRRIPSHWIRPRLSARRTGTRVGALSDLQLVCGVGLYELDVLVREREHPRGLEFAGQLTCADAIHVPAVEVPLTLVAADGVTPVCHTRSDDFGDFGFVRQPPAAYGLRVGVGDDAPCVLVWDP